MQAVAGWVDRHQIPLYLGALALGVGTGLLLPGATRPAGLVVSPVIMLLLYVTFLEMPVTKIGAGFRDWRFVTTVVVLNFVVVPVVVFALSRFVADDRVLLIGVLLVLLTPCIDYVIVFTGLAGGAHDRLLAVSPILMLTQMLLLPGYLWLFAGADFAASVSLRPFLSAFFTFIVVPLFAAAVTQFVAARVRWGARLLRMISGAMVPLMMLTLAVVVASQIGEVTSQFASLFRVAIVYVVFAAIMLPVGAFIGRMGRVDLAARRAVVMSGATRNSLVVLPLALALPPGFELAPLVVVSQTLVELLAMVVFVQLVPRLIRDRSMPPREGAGSQQM